MNILKNQQLFLDLQDRGGHRQTTALKIAETDRQIQGVMAYQSRDSQVEATSETSAGKKTSTVIDELLEVLCTQL